MKLKFVDCGIVFAPGRYGIKKIKFRQQKKQISALVNALIDRDC